MIYVLRKPNERKLIKQQGIYIMSQILSIHLIESDTIDISFQMRRPAFAPVSKWLSCVRLIMNEWHRD